MSVTRSLRADEARLRPTHKVAVAVVKAPAGPIAARALGRVGGAVALVDDITGRRRVIARLAVGDGAADDGAADNTGGNTGTDRTAITAGVRRGRHRQRRRGESGSRRDGKNGLVHLGFPPGSRVGRSRLRDT